MPFRAVKSFIDFEYAIFVLLYIKRAKNGTIEHKYLFNEMDIIGNNDGKDDKIVMLCRWKMAGLLDFAHEVWYATVGILA